MHLIIKRDFDSPHPLAPYGDKPEGSIKEWRIEEEIKGKDAYARYKTLCRAGMAYPIYKLPNNVYTLLYDAVPGCQFIVWEHGREELEEYYHQHGVVIPSIHLLSLLSEINAYNKGQAYEWMIEDENGNLLDSSKGFIIDTVPSLLQFLAQVEKGIVDAAVEELQSEWEDSELDKITTKEELLAYKMAKTCAVTLKLG